jgi:hypothetical protein
MYAPEYGRWVRFVLTYFREGELYVRLRTQPHSRLSLCTRSASTPMQENLHFSEFHHLTQLWSTFRMLPVAGVYSGCRPFQVPAPPVKGFFILRS